MSGPLDPSVVDFVKALARANAARDITLARRKGDAHGEATTQVPNRSAG